MATEVLVPARQELEELAEAYRLEDEAEKEAAAVKKELRGPILELISEVIREEIPLTRITVPVPQDEMTAVYDDDYELYRKKNYPEYNLVGVSTDGDTVSLEFEEDDALKKFEFVVNGYKFGRTTSVPTPSFDAESFWQDNKSPKLRSLVNVEKVTTYELAETKAARYMAENPESKQIFEKYVAVGTPSVKLLPIRPLKEEE